MALQKERREAILPPPSKAPRVPPYPEGLNVMSLSSLSMCKQNPKSMSFFFLALVEGGSLKENPLSPGNSFTFSV